MQLSSARRARHAVAGAFLVHGFLIGAWVANIAPAQGRLAVGPGAFGFLLLLIALGAVIAMPLAGGLINRFGSAAVTRVTGFGFCALLPGPVLADSVTTFGLALLALGAAIGSMDVAMNAHGIAVEKRLRRPVMSSYHGLFSIGAALGSAAGAVLLSRLGATPFIFAASGLAVLVFIIVQGAFLETGADRGLSAQGFGWPTRASLALGALCFLALMAEGAVLDWTAISMKQTYRIGAAEAAVGYAVFATVMAISRLAGDLIRARLGAERLMRWSGWISALGLGLALLAPSPFLAAVAYGAAGLGLGNIAPILFAGGGQIEPRSPGRGIAAVTTLGYAGFLLGPPVIGLLAEAGGLNRALSLMVAALMVIALAARAAAAADRHVQP